MPQCNGNGVCDVTTGRCVCNSGFGGFNCSRKVGTVCSSLALTESVPCSSSSVVTLSESFGDIEDGFTKEYTSLLNCTWTVAPPPGYGFNLTIVVVHLDLEDGYDYLNIFQGPLILQSTRIASFTGSYPKPSGGMFPIVLTTQVPGPITINFLTDPSVVASGFKLFFGVPYDPVWLTHLRRHHAVDVDRAGLTSSEVNSYLVLPPQLLPRL